MSHRARILLFSAAGLLLAVGLATWAIYGAVHGEPAFYQQAVEREGVLAEKSSDEFLQQAAAAASDVRKPGRWDAVFTADQINGWLAVDMARNYPGLLPNTLSDPRVAIRPGDVTLACRYDGPEVRAVLAISCDVYLSAPNTVALRVKGAHCGLMPLPLGKVLEAISHTARELELPLEWRRSGGDPVALLSMAVLNGHLSAHRRVELDTIELRDGELFVAGRTEPASRAPVAAAAPTPPQAAASLSSPPPVEIADTRVEPAKTADSIKPAAPLPPARLQPESLPPPETPKAEPQMATKTEAAPEPAAPASEASPDQPSIAVSPQESSQR
jgi:hypothetical protein